jgi:hypothetical protein
MVRIGDINALPQRTPSATLLPGLQQTSDQQIVAMNPEERATMLMDVRDALTAQSTD